MTFLVELCDYGVRLVLLCVFLAVLPSVPHKTIRYYACYLSSVMLTKIFFLVTFPLFFLRPKNIDNLRVMSIFLKHITKICGVEWELRNGHILEEDRGAVIVANHQSIWDIMGMLNIWEVMRKVTVIAKKELLYAVPIGPAWWLSGIIFIDRSNPKTANQVLRDASRILPDKKVKLWVFPEGTRNKKGDGLLPFKTGAFRVAIEHQVPIIPLVYSPYYFIDSKNKVFREGKEIMSVLEPISTEGLTLDNIEELKQKVFSVMLEEYQLLRKEVIPSK